MSARYAVTFAVAVTACVAVVWWWSRSRDPESLATATIPLAAKDPFVDERECATCHPQHATSHRQSGHADTFRLSRGHEFARQLDGKILTDPERGYSFAYHHDEQAGLSVSIPERFDDQKFPLEFALGSGQHAVTFLTLVPDRFGDATGIEHRISLYRGASGWEFDLTPGHQGAGLAQEIEQLGKVIRGDTLTACVGCHTTTAEFQGAELVEFRANVGCQSCHGPGQKHVEAIHKEEGDSQLDWVTSTVTAEIELCGRCHRLPADAADARLTPNILQNVRFQPAGLIQSQCFQKSGTLKCSTCHDPHQHVSRDGDYYVRRCLTCHEGEKGTVCPVSATENCIRCHMPAIDVHRGITFHDHWIRKRP